MNNYLNTLQFQLCTVKKRTKQILLPRLSSKALFDGLGQVFGILRDQVGQLAVFAFAMVPNLFNRIQFRRISWKPLDIDPPVQSDFQFPNSAAMHHPSVEDQKDSCREVLQQISDEPFKIIGPNSVVFNRKIQSQTVTLRRAGQRRQDRQSSPAIPTAQNRRLPFGGPGAADRQLQQKPAFVQKNDGFTRSAGFLLGVANPSDATWRRPLDSAHGPCVRASGNSSPSGGEYARRWTGRRLSRSVFRLLQRSAEVPTVRSGSRFGEPLSATVFSVDRSVFQTDSTPVPADCGLQKRPCHILGRLFFSRKSYRDWPRQDGRPLGSCSIVPATRWPSAGVAPAVWAFL